MSQAEQQHEIIGVQKTTQPFEITTHPEAQWFLKGGNLGLFIHFGICTVDGGVDLSWGMIDEKPWDEWEGVNLTITPAAYFDLAKSFNPTQFDPDNWMKAIADAGFTYAVFTTRHHDGFALWPSEYGDFSTKNFMGGRDLVAEYIAACRKYNLKVGLYYSPPDWYYNRNYMTFHFGSGKPQYPDRKHYGLHHEVIETLPEKPQGWEEAYVAYVNGQIHELLSNYGRIDLLWFDGSMDDPTKALTIEEIRSIQPWIIVNHRLHGHGDFDTFECRMPESRPQGPWEGCHIWPENCGWAQMERSTTYKPASWVYENYRQAREWGGNYLINVGPDKTGQLPDQFYDGVRELKKLMEESK